MAAADTSPPVSALLPMLGLRLSAGPFVLKGLTDEDLVLLGDLAVQGIHPTDEMPFGMPWSAAPPPDLARNVAQYHWHTRATFSAESWSLNLGVWVEGQLVGTQGFDTMHYLVTRTGETGSWLGRAHQGKGIGTAMRQILCGFLFDHLDAQEITSGAFIDNPASLGVSRKVGYRPAGVRRLQRRPGELALNQAFTLSPGDLVRYEHPVEVEGLAAFRASIGL